ncbi:MAG: T9SS type A sorting domain-containing protein [Bacteroidota bacterium]
MRSLYRFYIVFIYCVLISLSTQAQHIVVRIDNYPQQVDVAQGLKVGKDRIRQVGQTQDAFYLSQKIDIPIKDAQPFISLAVVWESCNWQPEHDRLLLKAYSADGRQEQMEVQAFEHAEHEDDRFISQLYFIDASSRQFQFRLETDAISQLEVGAVEFHFYNPGKTTKSEDGLYSFGQNRQVCPCPPTDAIARSQWCPNGDCPTISNPTFTDVTHLIVHHSAGSNTSSDWAASVRSIWNFHVNTNGWSDIGYNYLVDPNGEIYVGRGEDIQGAHFCGKNAGTMGICMLGDFTNITPTDEAVASLVDLLSWKSCIESLNPLAISFHASSGLNLNAISGHQQGCATACPGAMFFPTFPALRQSVKENIDACQYLGAPYDLVGQATTEMLIQLEWQDNSPIENAFIIERSTSNNNNFVVIGSTPADSTLFKDPNIIANATYYYRVRAVNEQDTSAYSNEALVLAVITNTLEQAKQNFSIYPNPFNDWLQIDFDHQSVGQKQIRLFDAAGKQLLQEWQGQDQQIRLNLAQLTEGIYLLEVNLNGNTYYQKLIK